jgi:cytochrome c-type biogenesis protein CcmH/NrfG
MGIGGALLPPRSCRGAAFPAIWVQYGHMLKLCGQLDKAEEAYRQSLRLDPNHADTYAQLGHVLTLQNRPAAAAEAYRCALALDATLENAIAGVRALDAPDKECRAEALR